LRGNFSAPRRLGAPGLLRCGASEAATAALQAPERRRLPAWSLGNRKSATRHRGVQAEQQRETDAENIAREVHGDWSASGAARQRALSHDIGFRDGAG
jgi:hypothetical protein